MNIFEYIRIYIFLLRIKKDRKKIKKNNNNINELESVGGCIFIQGSLSHVNDDILDKNVSLVYGRTLICIACVIKSYHNIGQCDSSHL